METAGIFSAQSAMMVANLWKHCTQIIQKQLLSLCEPLIANACRKAIQTIGENEKCLRDAAKCVL